MSAIKEKFINLQEKVYTRLEDLGIRRETIYEFEEILSETDFFEFAEQMSGYAMAISMLSEITGYKEEYLWNIWKENVQDFIKGEAVAASLEEEWKAFKDTTNEKDW